MKIINFTDARAKLSDVYKTAVGGEPVIIRHKSFGKAVLISEAEYREFAANKLKQDVTAIFDEFDAELRELSDL
ncbi:type II toxin-antitoxin system Phd/YefM family antitoxin [Photorhabdus tasmaniensis]|nr:type II toxin-antitoxin system Phd/YefM family antitoxin [Photorhabdus tasmaniensis]